MVFKKDNNVMAKTNLFFRDFESIIKDSRLKNKIIIADTSVVSIFMASSWCYSDSCVNPNEHICISPDRNKVNIFNTNDLIKIVDLLGDKICWLTSGTSIGGCPLFSEKYKESRKSMGYFLVAAGSTFNGGYYGINLYEVEKDGSYEKIRCVNSSTVKALSADESEEMSNEPEKEVEVNLDEYIPKTQYEEAEKKIEEQGKELGDYKEFFNDINPLLEKLQEQPELVQAILDDKLTPELVEAVLAGKIKVEQIKEQFKKQNRRRQ